jgi:hypothetical protein
VGTDTTFEDLRQWIGNAPRGVSPQERRITYVGDARKLGFARDHDGQLEVFLMGTAHDARERVIKERLVHDVWRTAAGGNLEADRLCLPDDDHFDAFAATILLELVDKGYELEPVEAFRRTEPLIALALDPTQAQRPVLTGLAGELLTLATMIRLGRRQAVWCLDSWQGWDRSTRDFQLGPIGVEVKTSVTSASRHHVQGWYQVERGVSADGAVETHLYLLSIGIRWLEADSPGPTLEGLVKEILDTLPAGRRPGFVQAVRGYGGANLLVDDDGTAGQAALRVPFMSVFERLYDLQDSSIGLPTSEALTPFTHLVSDTVSFEIELPNRVRGDVNPVVGLAQALSGLLGRLS